ncbi:ABC transporter ATP-binding protein [Lawsonibacter celer]|jgi:putative ABC transport system ATP-binding protein|uniref:ABC transporter ATP-binding protein n=1 Tax=Lawsonibacter celer TaxID=2986526 RepID=UPI001645A9B5|nr:ABC transporter ATP-binding protein [Lawsonibacter celer]
MDIEAKCITKIYGAGAGRVEALRETSLTIRAGAFVSIMGPSGSGKSTLLHILSGLDSPTTGSVRCGDVDLHRGGDRVLSAFRRRHLGFVFQQFHLLPVLTARENILLPLLLDGRRPEEGYFRRLTALLGLEERLEHLPHELSGGQQQRVAIARALIAGPEVIFADEPTGNLDSRSGDEVMTLLKQLHGELGKTLVVITHDAAIAAMAQMRFSIVDGVLSGEGAV